MDQKILEFIQITGTSYDNAQKKLIEAGENLQLAVEMFWNGSNEEEGTIPLDEDIAIREPILPQRVRLTDETEEIRARRYVTPRRAPKTVFEAFRHFPSEQAFGNPIKKLADLFRPPLEILYKGHFDEALEAACKSNKWLLVNIQKVDEFSCQTLNRDTWSNESLKNLIRESFLFWQVSHHLPLSAGYVQYYKINKFPHIALIDPRSGESLKIWEDNIAPEKLIEELKEFLKSNTMEIPLLNQKPSELPHSIVDKTEKEQLELAIARSLDQEKTPKTNKRKLDTSTIENFDTKKKEFGTRMQDYTDRHPEFANRKPVSATRSQKIDQPVKKKFKTSHPNAESTKNQNTIRSQKIRSDRNDSKKYSRPLHPDCFLQIRLVDGRVLKGEFMSGDSLQDVHDFIVQEENITENFCLTLSFPRKVFRLEDLGGTTLSSAGLVPRAVLIVETIEA
eukprot:TRINITY_DN1125_c0_g4_i1.p1 TRINITY_DN1125_c0_g4~~TRINITY_DN1125_c0_g4_i1.p1  ORF type:complete len:450 (-),score=85.58 TRINITY_DN1125_c0_g4_i1:140-1489(-)